MADVIAIWGDIISNHILLFQADVIAFLIFLLHGRCYCQ